MMEIKSFVEVANNVNKVGKWEGVVLIFNISINMAFAGCLLSLLSSHTVIILCQDAIVVQFNILHYFMENY